MKNAIASLLKSYFESLPPNQRQKRKQYLMLGAASAGSIGLLWLVFSLSATPPRPIGNDAGRATDARTTHVDLMAPGQQVEPLDQWVGTAGRKLAQYENERNEQLRLNKERRDFEEKTLARFAELEKRLTAAPAAPAASEAARPPAPFASAAPPSAPSPSPPYPPADSIPKGLPPPPPSPAGVRGASPAGMPPPIPELRGDAPPPMPALVRVSLPPVKPTAKEDTADQGGTAASSAASAFLPVSFTRGELLGGLDAPTGGQAQANPQPVLIRLSDTSVLPNRLRADYKDCFVIAAGYGNISAERAYLRTESLSCVSDTRKALEVKIQGSVFGEDGKVGIRGRVVSKQGQMLANALLAGVASGIGQGLSSLGTTYSSSALGSIATASGNDAFKTGIGAGFGRALDRLAQYYIQLAEQTFPVIEVGAGREVDVVITKGVRLDAPDALVATPLNGSRPDDPSDRFAKVNDDEDL